MAELSLYILPRFVLLLTTLSSVFFLFFAAFSTPYINFIYFVKADFNSGTEIVTLGAFGFCSESGELQNCSPGATGYQFYDNLFLGPLTFLPIPVAVTSALVLHVVAFVLSLVVTAILLCNIWQSQSESLLARYVIQLVLLLATFNLASFAADLVLFSAAKKAFGTTAVVNIGNGTWLTLASLLSLFLGLLFHRQCKPRSISRQTHKNNISQDTEARGSFEDRKEVKPLTPTHYESCKAKSPNLAIQTSQGSGELQTARPHSAGAGNNEHTILTPVRRVPDILINGAASESPHTSPIQKSVQEHSSSRPSSIGYAPSTYSTYCSDGSSAMYFTPGMLSRASTSCSGVFSTRHPARRSTLLNPHTIEHWVNTNSHIGNKNRKPDNKLQHMSSSVIHQFPSIPYPQPVHSAFALQFRDRFIEHNPSIATDARSFLSAAPSSDIELDVQTIPPSSPTRSFGQEIPPLPLARDEEFLLA